MAKDWLHAAQQYMSVFGRGISCGVSVDAGRDWFSIFSSESIGMSLYF
jgi:hypothetical protein